MAHKAFKIIFTDKSNRAVDINYTLHDTELAVKWFSKIKHLSKIQIDPIESDLEDVSNLELIYEEFCDFAGLIKMPLQNLDQLTYNMLHKIFEDNHDRLAGKQDNGIMYRFHHAIHDAERGNGKPRSKLNVGWGSKEGLLTQDRNCHPFYENFIKKNNLYLPWAELAKTPYTYWLNKEPNDQKRFNELCKPHITFRAKFFVAFSDIEKPIPFPNQFNQYFNQFKSQWLKRYNMDDWTERDECCAPLLAYTDTNIDIRHLRFNKIIL